MAGSRTLKLSILADVDDLKKKLDIGSNVQLLFEVINVGKNG